MTEDRSDTDDERANTESAPFADHVASLPGDSGTDEAAAVDEALPDIPRADADDADDTQGPQQEFRRDRQGPLSDIASAVDERSTDAGESAFDELFEQEQVAEIDSDQLWDRLENDQPPDSFLEADREVREIDKHSYCHQCPHFAEPPELACGHDGTDILDVPSLETFRVADCPVVLENEDLEREY